MIKITDARRKKIKLCEKKIGSENWDQLFTKTEESDFLSGKSGTWKASFDWIIDGDHPVRIVEGNYDNAKKEETKNDDYGAGAFKPSRQSNIQF